MNIENDSKFVVDLFDSKNVVPANKLISNDKMIPNILTDEEIEISCSQVYDDL